MSKNSPYVIFDLEWHSPDDNSDENNFFRCKSKENIIDYLNREAANIDMKELDYNNFCNDLNALDLPKNAKNNNEKNIVDYANLRPGSTRLFNENGFLSKKNLNDLKDKLSKTKSIVWSGVVSFTPEIASQICSNPNHANQLISEHLPSLFKNTKIDYDNIEWTAAYHTNTDNRHIHLIMFEKAPTHINSNGGLDYTIKSNLPIENFANFKYQIASHIDEKKLISYNLRKETKDELAFNLKNDTQYLSYLMHNTKDIVADGHFQYSRLNKTQQQKINELVKETLKRTPEIAKKYNQYISSLQKDQFCILDIYKQNKTNPTKEAINFFSSRKKEFDVRLGNTLLKTIKETYILQSRYINFKKENNSKHRSKILLCKKKALGINNKEATNIVNSMNQTLYKNLKLSLGTNFINNMVKDMSIKEATKTMEQFLYEKRLQGESVYAE